MLRINHKIATNTSINDKQLTVVRCEDDNEVILVMVDSIEYAYVRVEDKGLDIGSDDYILTDSDKNTITVAVGNFLDSEPSEEATTDYTYDVREEQSIYHYGY